MRRQRQYPRTAFTLIEAVISIVIVGVMLAAALGACGAAAKSRRLQQNMRDVSQVGQDLLNEILQQPYQDPDQTPVMGLESGEAGANRLKFDDVDDYDNYKDVPRTRDGTIIPGCSNWDVKITVTWCDPTNLSPTNTDSGLKVITMKISPPGKAEQKFVALRSKWGPIDQQPSSQTTYISQLRVQLQVGGQPTPTSSSTVPWNQVP